MRKATNTAAHRADTTAADELHPLLELLGEADEGREFQPGVAFAGGAVVLRRRDGGQVPATFGTLDQLAQLRGRGHAAEIEPGVFRITAAGRQVLRAAGRGREAGTPEAGKKR